MCWIKLECIKMNDLVIVLIGDADFYNSVPSW